MQQFIELDCSLRLIVFWWMHMWLPKCGKP